MRAGSGNRRPLGIAACRSAAHNGLVAGSSAAGSTTHSRANRDFPRFEKDRFRGGSGPSVSGVQKPFPRSVGRTGQRLRFASDRDPSSNWCPVPIWGCSRAMTVGQNGAMSAAGAQCRDQTAPAISCRGRQAPADPSMLPELEWLNRADARLSSPRALFGAWPSARHRPCRTGSPRSAESGFETDGPCGTDCRSRPAIGRQLRFSSP